jgi:hypothetical protein
MKERATDGRQWTHRLGHESRSFCSCSRTSEVICWDRSISLSSTEVVTAFARSNSFSSVASFFSTAFTTGALGRVIAFDWLLLGRGRCDDFALGFGRVFFATAGIVVVVPSQIVRFNC